MIQKLADQLSTLLVVTLVILFCASGMTSCYHKKQPTSEPAASIEPTVPPTQTIPATEAPTRLVWPAEAPEGYFDDALFIGDSRTVGLQEYGNIPGASFFATSGMSVYSIFSEEVGKRTLQDLMETEKFGKVYLMLGINELGYDFNKTVAKYVDLVRWIQLYQPDAVVYVQANLHVSAKRSKSDKVYNNRNLDTFNAEIAKIADGEKVFYLDVNPLFDDGAGNLADTYTVDDSHVLGKYYLTWAQWLAKNAAVASA